MIAVEAFSCMLNKVVAGGFLSQVRGSKNERIDVSHLLFADDILIFCKATKEDDTSLQATNVV